MKASGILSAFFFFILLMTSCQKEDTPSDTAIIDITPTELATLPLEKNCPFVQNSDALQGLVDDTERVLMDGCRANQFTSIEEAEANMIGTWELIAYGNHWIPTHSNPCSEITITEDELVFQYEVPYFDTIATHTWAIGPGIDDGTYAMKITPALENRVFLLHFCPGYMYGNMVPVDGTMHVYAKAE